MNPSLNRFYRLFKKEGLSVIVAGSKNDPIFPISYPDIFVGAHGAIAHAKQYPDSTLKCGVVTNFLLCRQAEYCNTVRNLIKDAKLDVLIVIESVPRKYEDIHPSLLVGNNKVSILRLKPFQCSLLELKFLGFQYLYCCLSNLSPRKSLGFILQLITEKTSYLTRLSTGMFAGLYFYNLLPPKSKLYVVGIGLQISGPYFFDKSNKKQKKGHFAQDLFVANKLTRSGLQNDIFVEFTDSEALNLLSEMQYFPFKHYILQYLASIKT